MTFTNVKRNVSHGVSRDTHWKTALESARERLGVIEAEISQLKKAIKFFEDKIASGEPWPGDKEAGTAA